MPRIALLHKAKDYVWHALFLICTVSHAQPRMVLRIIPDSSCAWPCKWSVTQGDSSQLMRSVQESLRCARREGFLATSIDDIEISHDTLYATVHSGKRYVWASLEPGNVPENLQPTSLRRHRWNKTPLSPEKVDRILDEVVVTCENNGYPFARIHLDSIRDVEHGINAVLNLDPGKYCLIDSVRLNGKTVVAPVYLYHYVGIQPGDPYDESLIRKTDVRLRELAFVTVARPSSILFTPNYTRLDLFIEPRKASQFDGVIGLLPNADGQGSTKLTGEAHLKLQNSFKRGEIIEFNWRQMPPQSQDLKIRVLYPFLFNSPLGIDGGLQLYKRDTQYVDITKILGVMLTGIGADYLKVFVNNKQSNLQSTVGLENVTTLPPFADITVTGYGVDAHREELDYRINPSRGFDLTLAAQAGNRTIRKNAGINPAVYEELTLNSTQYQGVFVGKTYVPLRGKSVGMFELRAASLYSRQLFDNECYRLGGLKSLRGFDEESIFATSFILGNIEYRYLTEQNSFFSLFLNGCWWERNTVTDYSRDIPFGFGAGYNFQTKLGILSLNYALGKQENQPIQLRNGKVHFGIVNYF